MGCRDDDEVPLPRGGARRHGEHMHTKEDYLPHGNECEDNPYKRDHNPCKEGYYCADDDLCNSGGLDCCKPRLSLDEICDDNKDCQYGLYCADKRDVGGRYDLCRPIPKKYSHLTICDKDYECPKGEYCDERNCPREFDSDCCGGKIIHQKRYMTKNSTDTNIKKTKKKNSVQVEVFRNFLKNYKNKRHK